MTTITKQAQAREHMRDALYHLTACWDALYEVESNLNVSVEVEDISMWAGGLDLPEDAYTIDDEEVDEMVESLSDPEEEDE